MTKGERARSLRYKRPALESLGFSHIQGELGTIDCECDDIRYFIESDEETLLAALDGDEEEEFEFKIAFADLGAKCEQLQNAISEFYCGWHSSEKIDREFDDCIVSLIGNRYTLIGYDSAEEDYYSLVGYESELAYTEAGKRLMRHTKAEMLSKIGQSLGILIAYLDVRQQYDYLKATFDILRDKNTSVLKQIKAYK